MRLRRRITVEGLNLERFIRRAAVKGMSLNQLERVGPRRLITVVHEAALPAVQAAAEEGGWRLSQDKRVGAGRLIERLRGRCLLLIALGLLTALVILAGRCVWQVKVMGAGTYMADVTQFLDETGYKAPILRSEIDLLRLRDELEWRYPNVAWVECGIRGMRLEIRFVQGITGEADPGVNGPCDVVASRTGVVQSIVTRAGTPVVKTGDLVREGDVLIRGEERTSGGEVRSVAARGSVYARVWDSAAVKTSLRVVESEPTGRTQSVQGVSSPWFSLWTLPESGYQHQDISFHEQPLGGFFWPLIIRSETRIETDIRSVTTDYRSFIEENNRAALQKLSDSAGGRESLVDNWVNWSIIEDEILLSVATGERLMDIAQQERSTAMAAAE